MSLSIFVFQKNGGMKYEDISERKAEELLYVTGETDPTVGKMWWAKSSHLLEYGVLWQRLRILDENFFIFSKNTISDNYCKE